MSPVFEKYRGRGLGEPPRHSMLAWIGGFLALAFVASVLIVLMLLDHTSKHCVQIGYGFNPCHLEPTPTAETP